MYPSKAGSTLAQQGIFDNGYIKVDEVEDGVIEEIMGDEVFTESGSLIDAYDLAPSELLEDYSQTTGLPMGTQSTIDFQQETTSGYRNRTIKNASADATIAFAYNFNSAGEKLTKSSVLEQNKKYIPLTVPRKTETSDINKADITSQVNVIVDQLNSVNAKTLNIAGNGIYTMREAGWNQSEVDMMVSRILKAVMNSPNLKNKIESVRTGGQTGFDEAGAKAAIELGIPTTILAPKGWTFRNMAGQDISNEQQFKDRFNQTKEDPFPCKNKLT
jgi:hypothetical protein